ncbi:Actin protein 6 [Fasciola gigantica]|uniref:Actin protein 6 n=1 Tax=Fasciola gigantica TaxID=46835 RepID=A0A504Z2J0_FASGI|nr:Actin protein 6 [Fasciola gigantica]
MPTLTLDMGGGSLKLGFSDKSSPSVIDNCIFKSKTLSGRTFIGSEIEKCNNFSSLYCIMPFKKGYLNNWDIQTQILDTAMKKIFKERNFKPSDCNLICTEPYFNFSSTKETMNEIFFEEYQFSAVMRTNPAFLSAYKYQTESAQRLSRYCLVVDSGYSFTHIVPMCDGRVMSEFVIRLTVGGKILTNRLVEIVSYRANPRRNPIVREYVLPDYADVHRGYVRDPSTEQPAQGNGTLSSDQTRATQQGYVLRLNNERFTIPELIFHPSDVGYAEMGLTEAMGYLLSERLPSAVRPGAWANCLVTGGNACFPGFVERLRLDLRSVAPDDLPVNIFKPNNPQVYAWEGGALLANETEDLKRFLVTRAEYEECGSAQSERRFPVS